MRHETVADAAAVEEDRIVGLVESGKPIDRARQHAHEDVELIAIDARYLEDHIDTGPAEPFAWHDRQPGELAAAVPHGLQAEGVENLAFDDAQMPGCLTGPQAESELCRALARMLRAISLDKLFIGLGAGFERRLRRHFIGFESEEIAPARHVRIADRIATGTRLHEATRQALQQGFDLAGFAQMPVKHDGAFDHGTQIVIGDGCGIGAIVQETRQEPVGFGLFQCAEIAGEEFIRLGADPLVKGLAKLLHHRRKTVLCRRWHAERMQSQRHGMGRQSMQMIVQG